MDLKIDYDCLYDVELYNLNLLKDELIKIERYKNDVSELRSINEEYLLLSERLKSNFFNEFKKLNNKNYVDILNLKNSGCNYSKNEVLKRKDFYQQKVSEYEKNIKTYELLEEYTYLKVVEIEEAIFNEKLMSLNRRFG